MIAKLCKPARIFISPMLLFSLLVGFRSLEQKSLTPCLPKAMKILYTQMIDNVLIKIFVCNNNSFLIAHLYLNLA